ncbi:MAG TPA: hypothetical protein VF120_00410 [Ktedonobacterales bacterium]
MNLLQDLFGGGDQVNAARDFVNRYQEGGNPTTGYSMQEALHHYGQVVPNLSPEQYQQAAQQSFSNMGPDLRNQFGQILQQQAQQHGLNLPNLTGAGPEQLQNPNFLSQVTGNLHNQGILGTILGGVLGGAASGAAGGFSHGGLQGALGGAESGAMGGAQSGGLGSVLGGLTGGNQGFNQGSGIEGAAGGFAGNMAENAAGNMGGIFGNPAVKAAIGGIAANGVQSILRQHGI